MAKAYRFGHKVGRKSWDPKDINPEQENRKAMVVFLLIVVAMILLAVFMWWARK